MGHALLQAKMTAQEFLLWDHNETVRREFVRGEVFAMAGGEDSNNIVAGNLFIAIRNHLRGTPCRVLVADVKLRIEAADCFFYPDIMVTCSANDAAQPLIKQEAKLVVEVLSPSTAAYDRGDKFAAYRLLPSLQEYLLIEPRTRRCEMYRKGPDGLWVLHPSDEGQMLELACLDLKVSAAALWEDVPLPGTRTAADSPASDQAAPSPTP
jgi:Uma2 family endonuclease